jgi:hypothetical protein
LVTLLSKPTPGPLGRAHISCKSRKCMRNCRRKSKVNSRFFFLALELCNFNHARVAKIALETVQRERLSTPRFLRSALRSYHQMTVARFHYRVACETARTSCFPKYLYFLYALSLRPLYICSCSKSDRVAAHVLYHASRTGIEYIGYTSVIQGPHKLRKNSIPTPLTGEASHAASGIES